MEESLLDYKEKIEKLEETIKRDNTEKRLLNQSVDRLVNYISQQQMQLQAMNAQMEDRDAQTQAQIYQLLSQNAQLQAQVNSLSSPFSRS